MSTSSIITCNNVTVSYGGYIACSGITFSINPGDYVCIVGANGSGKTTIVKAILGLIPVKEGTIVKNSPNTGYLPQQSNIQRDFPASVLEVVLSGSRHIFYTKQDRISANNQIDKLGLTKIKDKSFKELSGGQMQRVLLARSLCAAKSLLVLDEPVTGLDPIVTDEFYEIIRHLNKEEGLAILMVSHDVHRAVQNASHILQLNKTQAFYGTSQEYKNSSLYTNMSHVEVCETHFCNHCGSDCNAFHLTTGSIHSENVND